MNESHSEVVTTRKELIGIADQSVTILEREHLVFFARRRHPGKGIVGHQRRYNNRARKRLPFDPTHDPRYQRHVLVPILAHLLSEKQIPAERLTI